MAETGGLFIIDGEDIADSSPWEFASVVKTGTCTLTLQAAAKNQGTYGYKCLFDGTTRTCYGTKAFAAQTDLYLRFYLYVPTAFTIAENGNHCLLHVLKGGGTDLLFLNLYGGSGTNIGLRCIDDVAAFYAVNNVLTRNIWHYVETYWKVNATTGGGALYLDGGALGNNLDHDTLTASKTADNIKIGSTDDYSNVPAASDYFYMDDIKAASTGPIGAYSGGTAAVVSQILNYYRRLRT